MPPILKVIEGTSCILRGDIEDDSDPPVGIAAASITDLRWTLYEITSGAKAVIGGIVNTQLTPVATYVPSTGVIQIPVSAAQNVINTSGAESERHVVMVKFTHSSGKINKGEFEFDVIKDLTPTS